MTVPLLGKGLWTLLIEEDKTSGESSGTQQADEESSDRPSHVRGSSGTRTLCPSALLGKTILLNWPISFESAVLAPRRGAAAREAGR